MTESERDPETATKPEHEETHTPTIISPKGAEEDVGERRGNTEEAKTPISKGRETTADAKTPISGQSPQKLTEKSINTITKKQPTLKLNK